MYTAGIITMSDKGSRGERVDKSGPLIEEILRTTKVYEVKEMILIPDDKEQILEELIRMSDILKLDLILTTGGTGFSIRDVTPEATLAAATRNAPGIAEAIRAYSMTVTKRAMLSRGVSVIRGQTLIINLPGSPKAVEESLTYILSELGHGIDILKGSASECARREGNS
ncbi:MAG: molybdopterin adenylyltransferase [Clostridiales bacterium]|nr:molybdopterin adenylyltransferase [Clostridiales bacterium]